MTRKDNSFITTNQMACILIITIMGTEVLYLPNYMVRIGGQAAWIYEIIGLIYPLYIVCAAVMFNKKSPNDNILKLSKKYFGNIFGSVLNFLFLIQFIFYTTIRLSQLNNLIRVFITYFLTPQIVISVAAAAAAYSSYKGLKILSRMNEVALFFTFAMVLVPLGALKFGSISNLLPLFDPGTSHIMEGIVAGLGNYYGIEIFLLIYPYMKDKTKMAKAGVTGSIVSGAVLVWFTFITIYYLGIDIVPKFLWPVIATTKALNLVVIKNFTFIFIFFWVIFVQVNIANNYFAAAFILNDFVKKISIQIFSIILLPIVFYISLKFGNETLGRNIMRISVPYFTMFNIIFVSTLAVIIIAKKHKAEKNT